MEKGPPLESARRVVDVHVPLALGAVLSGSVLTAHHTSTSDLDVVVFVGAGGEAFRETHEEAGWLAELFVQTPTSFDYFVAKEVSSRRPALMRMCAEGTALFSQNETTEGFQAKARHLLDEGPPPLTRGEVEHARYFLTDLLDDLRGATDEIELTFIASTIMFETAEVALASSGQWLGTGKWLARRLQQWNPELATRLDEAVSAVTLSGNRGELEVLVLNVLDSLGGPLSSGFRQSAPREVNG